jgi:hypothetical protein
MTKKTTTICCAVALLATTAATPALSQSKNFAGPSIAISGAFNSGDVKGTAQTDDENASSNFGKSNIIPGIDLSYGIPIDNNFLVNIGATYDLSKSTLADARASLLPDEGEDNDTYTTKLTIKDHYSFYIQPTYLVSNTSAIFAKLSYNFAKGSYTETATNLDPTSFTVSRNMEGFGYGIGLKSLLNNNLYVQVEAGIDEYDKESATDSDNGITYSIDPKVVTGKISIGYKF